MSLWELVLAAIGLYLLVVGRLSLMGREVRGRVARQIGLLLMAPLAVVVLVSLVLSVVLPAGGEALSRYTAGVLTLFEMALVIAALGRASYLFVTATAGQSYYWRGEAPPPPDDPFYTAPPGRMTVPEAARALRISELEVLGLIRAGALSATRVGPTYHIDRQAVDRLRLMQMER